MDEPASFGQWLKRRRRDRRLTQEDLAERIACSGAMVRKIEAGERVASQQLADLLAEFFAVVPAERAAFAQFARGLLHSDAARRELWQTLHSVRAHATNLVVPLTTLIGREQELALLSQLLLQDQGRLLTLTGPPGIGKTRLSLEVGVAALDHFADGIFFVGLATVSNPDLVLAAIAAVLSIPDTSGDSPLDALQGALSEKHTLLLLDNFEQVLDAAPFVLALLGACPRLKVLVTSREALHVYGEQQFPVPLLALADPENLPPLAALGSIAAVALFTARARAVSPDFALTEKNARAVAAICRRLDGLPIAIELAAARIRLFSPQELQARLDSLNVQQHRFMLSDGPRNLPARQRSLRAAIDWSYHLLSTEEQTLFARLSVFVGGCTLTASAAVCNIEDDLAFDVQINIGSLLDKSLLKREEGTDGASRFTMLATLRDYALERLQMREEKRTLGRAHALYFMRLAEEGEPHLTGSRQQEWLNRLEDEHDNIRAALRWVAANNKETAIAQSAASQPGAARQTGDPPPLEIGLRIAGAIWRFWMVRGYLSEGREQLQRLLATAAAADDHVQIPITLQSRAFQAVGGLALRQGDYTAARSALQQAIATGGQVGDKKGVATALNALGHITCMQGDYPAALALHERSLAIQREIGNKVGISWSLHNLGAAYYMQGDYQAARSLHEQSLTLKRELGDKHGIALSLGAIGLITCMQGDYQAARLLQEQSLAIQLEIGNKVGIAWCLGNLGNVSCMQGDYQAARSPYEQSLVVRRELGDKRNIAASLAALAEVATATGRAQQGAALLGAAQALLELIGSVFDPEDRLPYERATATAIAHLGEEVFARVWAQGRNMPMAQAIKFALEPA